MTTEERLGALEERTSQHDAAIADVRAELRQGFADVRAEIRAVNLRVDALNSRIDRVFLAILGIGAAQIALLITLIIRG